MASYLIGETGFPQAGLHNPIKVMEMSCAVGHRCHQGKKQGATGITTVAPYVAGQWGRGEDRLPG
jgi:hypothetical protein